MDNRLRLLGQAGGADSIFNSMGSSLRGGNGLEWITLAKLLTLLAGVVLAIAFAVYMAARLRRRWRSTPTWLFLRLCRAHRLTWTEQWLLWRVTRELVLSEPAQVFIEPACLEHGSSLPALSAAGPRLLELRDRLFAAEENGRPRATPATSTPVEPAAVLRAESPAYRPPDDSAAAIEDLALNELLAPLSGLPLQWPSLPPSSSHDAVLP